MFADFHPIGVLVVDLSVNTISIATHYNVLNWFTVDVVVMAIDLARWKNVNRYVFNVPKSLHLVM